MIEYEIEYKYGDINVGDKFPTENKLLNKMGYKKSSGNTRLSQLRDAKTYLDWERTNKKYRGKGTSEIIITKLYDKRIEKVDKRHDAKNYKEFEQFNLKRKDSKKSGVYKIQLENKIYIGQTSNFRRRFLEHYNGIMSAKEIKEILSIGAKFNILEIEYNLDKRLEKEKYYIDKYSSDKKYVCINKRDIVKEKYKIVRVKESDYNIAIKILKENGLI